MPSALEKLVKILRLEQETGYKNTAVIGGLQSFMETWRGDAHRQAKTDEHHALVEELRNALLHYDNVENKEQRYTTIRYMLGRITGRQDPDPEFVVEWTEADTKKILETLDQDQQEKTEEKQKPQQQSSPKSEHKQQSPKKVPQQKKQNNGGHPLERESEHEYDEVNRDVKFDVIGSAIEPLEFLDVTPDRLEKDGPIPKPRRARRPDLTPEEEAAKWNALQAPIDEVKGVGARRKEQLNKIGVETVGDLLFLFPRRYDDYTRVVPLAKVEPFQNVTVVGTIKSFNQQYTHDKRGYVRVVIEDLTGTLSITFFGQPHLKRFFRPGMQIACYGKTEIYLGQPQMSNPEWEQIDEDGLYQGSIVPVYPLTKGLSNKVLRNLIREALMNYGATLPDYVPLQVLERTELVDLSWALRQVHFPENHDFLRYAQERLAFDDLMIMQLGVLRKRYEWQSEPGIALPTEDQFLDHFADNLPYDLTNAQTRAINAIRADIERDVPMNRLLQGDVGSGKTVVAAMSLAMAINQGYQAAIMAPTGILAEQHYHGIGEMIRDCMPNGEEIEVRLLTGGTPESERQEIYEGLANGHVQLVVGTHALFQDRVEFDNLALAVIDEQHRFGVNERGNLRGKGNNPHVLVMTATPIPRTLALTAFADLDLTILDEMPPGRQEIKTRLIVPEQRERAYDFIRDELSEGRQAYIIYPLVEESENINAKAAVQAYEELSEHDFFEYRVGLMHGRLSQSEKDEIMAAFAQHELDVLISTTVIEVGINVPNASVIMIEGANRFGLAQLHQLRGRVGRGEHQSYCLLLGESSSDDALERLRALEQTTDGFELAQVDWEMRGPGDLLGTRQSGNATLDIEKMMNTTLVELAQIESRSLFEEDPLLQMEDHALLRQRVYSIGERRTDFS